MNSLSLNDIFTAVRTRIAGRMDSLNGLEVLTNEISFEGWLKVEAINALNEYVCRTQNEGSDLKLNDGSKIELKASMVRVGKGYFYDREGRKYVDPILLIAGGDIDRLERFASQYGVQIIESETLDDSLVIAIVRP